jgi:DNA-binding NarL/FixJ family response regulator
VAKTSIRILVVDDYEPFRRFARSTISERPEFQVIGEVSDGLEAVQSAEELQPDLILLDISLPKLNGIEAARRIREHSPKTKILFFSENRSPQIVEEALSTGAGGYLLKSDAARELFAAMEAALQGKPFLSSSLSGQQDGDYLGSGASPQMGASMRRHEQQIPGRHEVVFYSDDRHLIAKLSQFVGAALSAGNAAVVVATGAHQQSLLQSLRAGVDIAAAIEQGRYITLDAADAVSIFMVNGIFDSACFLEYFRKLIVAAAKAVEGDRGRVAIFGEGVDLLLKQGNAEAAIEDEKVGTHLCKTYSVDILCGYSLENVQDRANEQIFHQICAEHSAVHHLG